MSDLTFEVLAFRSVPVTAAVAVLELEGRFSDRTAHRLGRPCLLVEDGPRDRSEWVPVSGTDAAAGPGGVPWRASFAVPTTLATRAAFALEVGRDLLVDLPPPDLGEGDSDEGARLARLAREANDLRRRLDEAAARTAAAEAAAAAAREEADQELISAGQEAAEAMERLRAETAAEVEATRQETERQLAAVREQSDHLLSAARAEAEAALAAERERHEREVAAVREQANHAMSTSEAEAEAALAAARGRAAAERERHERELAAVREQSDRALATALREASAGEAEPPDAQAPQVKDTGADAGPEPAGRSTAQTAAGQLWSAKRVSDAPTEVVESGRAETVRVLSPSRRRRHSAEDEREPATLAAGATRVGARSIGTSGHGQPTHHRRRDPQRLGALIALAIAIAAFVLVVVLRIGPI